ncbi:MAG TPA: bifunctional pyr operon transcriptional regulator/uracil phosphoribosyltransferase PyrR [Chloroflexota bacterium]|nr:bifunctional pyr operon transcriptional regulator/uracil phosphoribosyltransferase PyrR [Chloroflexota bacterium]
MNRRQIMDADDMRRALTRIAHEIVEQNSGAADLVLVGMHTRGVPLARRVAAIIGEFEAANPPVGELDITLYRDDFGLQDRPPAVAPTDIPFPIEAKNVILFDDVLFTGRTVRAALDALIDFGRPRTIQLGVMIDRGHRELPIRADYVGKNLPTARNEDVELRVQEIDGADGVAVATLDRPYRED